MHLADRCHEMLCSKAAGRGKEGHKGRGVCVRERKIEGERALPVLMYRNTCCAFALRIRFGYNGFCP